MSIFQSLEILVTQTGDIFILKVVNQYVFKYNPFLSINY